VVALLEVQGQQGQLTREVVEDLVVQELLVEVVEQVDQVLWLLECQDQRVHL
tara:strand:- start:42 stop:197 length:156 start_codon:yes stop_codon:yes gene_type:complete